MKLIRINETHKNLVYEMMDEWTSKEEKLTPWAIVRKPYKEDFKVYLESLENGFVGIKESTYFVYHEEEKIFIGAVNIRHSLDELILLKTGHIGYGLRPSARNKGYAKEMLKLALEVCGKLGITKALLVCDPTNLPSKHTIIGCGGVLENEIEYNGFIYQRYWIDTKS